MSGERITTQERVEALRKNLQSIEKKIDSLSERSVETGKLLERKRIYDQALNEYSYAFKNNQDVAEFIRRFMTFILEEK